METKGVQLKESIISHEASKMKDELGLLRDFLVLSQTDDGMLEQFCKKQRGRRKAPGMNCDR